MSVCVCVCVRACMEWRGEYTAGCPSATPQWGGSPTPGGTAGRWWWELTGAAAPPRAENTCGLSLPQGPSLCEALQRGVPSGGASPSYSPACRVEDGGFSPVQCDPAQGSCWCVLGSGQEVPGTRVAGSQPACESKW